MTTRRMVTTLLCSGLLFLLVGSAGFAQAAPLRLGHSYWVGYGPFFVAEEKGYFDEEGYLFVVGRKKDMVKSGGISIYPLEIEGVLYKHPDIVEAAVIGVPDSQWGEAVKAVVVLKEGSPVTDEMLMQFCKEQLAGYKVPKSVDIVAALPHTEIGKVNKVKLKESVLAARVPVR